jgi:hypothetical protein
MFSLRQILTHFLLLSILRITPVLAAPTSAEIVQLSPRTPGLPALYGASFNILHKHVDLKVPSVVQFIISDIQSAALAEITTRYPNRKVELANGAGGSVSFPLPDISIVLKDLWIRWAHEEKWQDANGVRHQHDNGLGFALFSVQDHCDGVLLADGSPFKSFETFRSGFERVFYAFMSGQATSDAAPDTYCPVGPLYNYPDCAEFSLKGYHI